MYFCNNILRRLHSEVCIKLTLMHTLKGTALSAPYPVHAMFPLYKPDVALKVVNMHN